MKTIKKTFMLFSMIGVLFLSLQSCNKDEYEIIDNGESTPTGQELKNLFDGRLANITTVLDFNASTNLNYSTPKGLNLQITGSCLRKNGNPVVGNVKVEFIEIINKGNMLTTNKPTMGNTAGEKRLLISGGEFLIRATQDGVNLTTTCPISLRIPTAITGGTDMAMQAYAGTVDANGELSWDQAVSYDMVVQVGQAGLPDFYNALIPNFGWFNCDRFMSYPGPKTTITARVPAGYGGSNTSIFVTTKTIPNSLGKSYGQFPVGMEGYIIFVTAKDGKFRYAAKPQTLTANHTVTFDLSETTVLTAEQLTTAINALL